MPAPITVQYVVLRMLKYFGIQQLAPVTQPSNVESIQPGDLDDVITCLNGAMQELYDVAPTELREQPRGALLAAPLGVTLIATYGSATISAFGAYTAAMAGCTIRLAGDTQDNEIVSATQLARPFIGTGGSISATVYFDCINLGNDVDHVLPVIELPNQAPLYAARDRMDFIKWLGVPLVTDPSGWAYQFPFYFYYQKQIARPRAWFCESYLDPAQSQEQKRIRVGPMPDQVYPLSYRVAIRPPHYSTGDIYASGDTTYADPNTLIPVPNSWVESVLLPYALQRMTSLPAFRNEAAKAGIAQQYKTAEGILQKASVTSGAQRTISYVG